MFLFCKDGRMDLTCHFVYTCQFSNEFNDLTCFYRAVGGRVFIPSSVSFGHGGPFNMCVVCDVLRGAGRKKNKGLRESPFAGYKTAWRCHHSSVQSGMLYRRHTFFWGGGVEGLCDLHMRRVAVKAFGVWNRERVYFAYRLPSCVVIHSFMIIVFKGQHVSCGSARKLFCIVM
jgi:hypothetical protein